MHAAGFTSVIATHITVRLEIDSCRANCPGARQTVWRASPGETDARSKRRRLHLKPIRGKSPLFPGSQDLRQSGFTRTAHAARGPVPAFWGVCAAIPRFFSGGAHPPTARFPSTGPFPTINPGRSHERYRGQGTAQIRVAFTPAAYCAASEHPGFAGPCSNSNSSSDC